MPADDPDLHVWSMDTEDIAACCRTWQGAFDVARRGGRWWCSCGRDGCVHTQHVQAWLEDRAASIAKHA
jgi:hypothetical protein